MKVLSLFDGIAGARQALKELNIDCEYYASELDRFAIEIAKNNHPNIIQLGNVCKIKIKVLYLSEVYDFIKNNLLKNEIYDIQNTISEQDFLYRLNQEQTFATNFRTLQSCKKSEISENPTILNDSKIWFFRNENRNNKPIFNIIRSGASRENNDKGGWEEMFKHSFWWNGNGQQEYQIEKENCNKLESKKPQRGNEEKDSRSFKEAICQSKDERVSETECHKTISRPKEEKDIFRSDKEDRQEGVIIKKKIYRKEKEGDYFSENPRNIQTQNENDRACVDFKYELPIYQEIQATLVECEWGFIVFKGIFQGICGGSPCQDLSCAKRDGKGLDGERSSLFYEYLRILKEVKPKFFILENVASMSKQSKQIITQELFDIEPVLINSALVTAQQRKRLYWVGALQKDGSYKEVEVKQPEDKNILLKDIIESGDTERLKSYCITATYSNACPQDYLYHAQRQMIYKGCALRGRHLIDGKRRDISGEKTTQRLEVRNDEKTNCLTTVSKDTLVLAKDLLRRLTPVECERLQGFPDGYTEGVSNTQRYKALGNSFTVPVIKHLIQAIKPDYK